MANTKKNTEEKIIEVVDKAMVRHTDDLAKRLSDNINAYAEGFKGDKIMEQNIVEMATMSTAMQISVLILKEALIELLCEN